MKDETTNANTDAGADERSIGSELEPVNSWKDPKQNLYRLISVYWGFTVFGMSDSSIGVLLPSLEKYYDLDHLVASVAFVAPFCGYILASLMCDWMNRKFGRWGVAIIGPTCQFICYLINVFAPPFPVFVIAYAIGGIGNGTVEAAWNSWVGGLENANLLMGLLHGFYGAGGIICPSVFTAVIDSGRQWNICYSIMIAMGGINIILACVCWWGDTPQLYQDSIAESQEGNKDASIKVALKSKLVWALAIILFLYVGAEVALGGWITTFMIDVRNGDDGKMGYVTTGFWAGLTLGRVALGAFNDFVHHEEISLAVYLALAIGLVIVFWLVNVLVVSAVTVALVGFFIGPAFPIIIVVAMKRLPKWLHVSGIGFSAAVGGGGAAILPFVNGIISQSSGPQVLGPYALALLGAMLVGWVFVVKFL